MIPLTRWPALACVPHTITTRQGGVSGGPYTSLNLGYSTADLEDNVATNRRIMLESLGADPARTMSGWLTHGNEVSEFHAGQPEEWPVVRRPVRPGSERTDAMFRSDGVVSDVPGLHLVLTVADCVPILFADPGRRVVGAAHAGWRGTAAGVGPAVVKRMCDSFGCRVEDIGAVIGPSIGPCCYSVGDDVPAAFADNGLTPVLCEQGSGSLKLDLWQSNAAQLLDAGMMPDAVNIVQVCTSCNHDLYFSHRAESGVTGRFAACIGLA